MERSAARIVKHLTQQSKVFITAKEKANGPGNCQVTSSKRVSLLRATGDFKRGRTGVFFFFSFYLLSGSTVSLLPVYLPITISHRAGSKAKNLVRRWFIEVNET